MEEKKCPNCGMALTGTELVCWGCGFNLQNPDDPENEQVRQRIKGMEDDKAFWDSIGDMMQGLLYILSPWI